MQGQGKREIPEKLCRPAASSGTILVCKNLGATLMELEPDRRVEVLAGKSPITPELVSTACESVPDMFFVVGLFALFHCSLFRNVRVVSVTSFPSMQTETEVHSRPDSKSRSPKCKSDMLHSILLQKYVSVASSDACLRLAIPVGMDVSEYRRQESEHGLYRHARGRLNLLKLGGELTVMFSLYFLCLVTGLPCRSMLEMSGHCIKVSVTSEMSSRQLSRATSDCSILRPARSLSEKVKILFSGRSTTILRVAVPVFQHGAPRCFSGALNLPALQCNSDQDTCGTRKARVPSQNRSTAQFVLSQPIHIGVSRVDVGEVDEYGASPERMGGGSGRSLRKPADQRLRPARKSGSDLRRESNPNLGWEASSQTTTPPRPRCSQFKAQMYATSLRAARVIVVCRVIARVEVHSYLRHLLCMKQVIALIHLFPCEGGKMRSESPRSLSPALQEVEWRTFASFFWSNLRAVKRFGAVLDIEVSRGNEGAAR
ncbi:hypothetical protein PR048_029423 [Dryococelus australis]|uniref:Uncharacterized protein n=1 Tax=Dryococelus australis TaxID=614101 RepID=A0ABQ9GFT4_9NEOP|nr:hypothetical protein PR048_029423 [Dryococelus australis]